jgi:hypothetical protein
MQINNYYYTCTATSSRSSLRALTVNVKITNKTETKDRQQCTTQVKDCS